MSTAAKWGTLQDNMHIMHIVHIVHIGHISSMSKSQNGSYRNSKARFEVHIPHIFSFF